MNLAVIWTVAKKELIDLFRDRRPWPGRSWARC